MITPESEVRALWAAAVHEVNYRTVASRAYYACFNRGMSYAATRGHAMARTGADHVGVAELLRRQVGTVPNRHLLYRVGATLLSRSKRLRTQADYDRSSPFRRASAETSCELLDEIMDCFNQVES